MGSSSGGYSNYGSVGAQERASARNAQSAQVEMEINEFLESLLKDINNRDVEAIRTHIAEIERVYCHLRCGAPRRQNGVHAYGRLHLACDTGYERGRC